MTNRRGFLAALASTLALDPERLLWVPGAKTISIPRILPKLYIASYTNCWQSNYGVSQVVRLATEKCLQELKSDPHHYQGLRADIIDRNGPQGFRYSQFGL